MEQPGIAMGYDYTGYIMVNGTYRFSLSFINGLDFSRLSEKADADQVPGFAARAMTAAAGGGRERHRFGCVRRRKSKSRGG
jgi:hypothetical protein